MNTHAILTEAGYGDHAEYPQIAKRAAALAKQGIDKDALLATIRREFGRQQTLAMRESYVPFATFGEPGVDIDWKAIEQMNMAMRLPVAVAGAMMPDAHLGYALPIGGVVKLQRAVSPSFVGYDIACRVTVSVPDIPAEDFRANREQYVRVMQAVSRFGLGANFDDAQRRDHAVMDDPLWEQLPHLKCRKDLAWSQLGSSGSGNHFFDALVGRVLSADADWLPVACGAQFAAIMTHSGSRGVGHKMAGHYMELAERETRLVAKGIPKGYGWLATDSEAGQEYLAVMGLMGRYAQANHHLIHDWFLKEAGLRQLARFENHHNYAWVMADGGVVHRKGATPAARGEVGIIPGSSGTQSYLVEGLGNAASLESSAHGAGRRFSRTAAKQQHDPVAFDGWMAGHDIVHIGVVPDETLAAYKNIGEVMALQRELVVPVAEMLPIAVIMGGDKGSRYRRKG